MSNMLKFVLNFVFGQTLDFSTLKPNSIALDGACQGPQVDAANRKFSFDHHAGCVRLLTLATCQQVWTALQLGLVIDEQTEVYINDLDADTVLAVWLLNNPDRINDQRIIELVNRIGLTDSHGPIFPPHAIHRELAPAYGNKDPQTIEMLNGFLAKLDAYANNTWVEPKARPEQTSKGFGWSPKTGWQSVESSTAFDGLYKQGYLAGVLYMDGPNGTRAYTVGKRSDLVPFNLGPSAKVKNPTTTDDYRTDTLLGRLALAEFEANPAQAISANWGGGSTVGGAARNPDGSRSKLTPEQVLGICRSLTGEQS